ncbi:hypothetical protein, partial [Pedobacter sp. Leaf216]|uniref:hypothetical protein n=1 Tax=Pedobacter sp. Leaf216 TaxID=1735684 RepID=UPI0012F82AF1
MFYNYTYKNLYLYGEGAKGLGGGFAYRIDPRFTALFENTDLRRYPNALFSTTKNSVVETVSVLLVISKSTFK